MRYKIPKIIVTNTIIGVMALAPLFNISAQTLAKAENKEKALEEVIEIKKVETVQDKKEALSAILDLIILEIADLKEQLNNLELDAEYINIQEQYLTTLTTFVSYLDSIKEKLNTEELTPESIKNLAQEFKTWGELIYSPEIKNILDFLLVSKGVKIYKISDARLFKITLDLKRFEAAKLIETESLKPLLEKATNNLRTAKSLSDEARMLLLATGTPPSLLSTSTFPTATALITATSTHSDLIQGLIQQSLIEIKSAYNLFFQMSALVKKLLKF